MDDDDDFWNFDGWSDTLQGAFKVGIDTWAQKELIQQNQQGQRYIEGQPGIVTTRPVNNNSGNILLLLAGAALIFALAR